MLDCRGRRKNAQGPSQRWPTNGLDSRVRAGVALGGSRNEVQGSDLGCIYKNDAEKPTRRRRRDNQKKNWGARVQWDKDLIAPEAAPQRRETSTVQRGLQGHKET